MTNSPSTSPRAIAVGWLSFLGSAGLVAGLLILGWDHPWFGVLALLAAGGFAIPALRAKQRFRQLMLGGDLDRLLRVWREQSEDDTGRLDPLLRATAQMSFGLTGRAQESLRFVRTEALSDGDEEAAVEIDEQLLFVKTVVAALEGDMVKATEHAQRMGELPLPGSRWLRGNAITLRRSSVALVRAFSENGDRKDVGWLRLAARQNPLVVWPMHYAEAIILLKLGAWKRAHRLLAETPEWPTDSIFRKLDRDLGAKAQAGSLVA